MAEDGVFNQYNGAIIYMDNGGTASSCSQWPFVRSNRRFMCAGDELASCLKLTSLKVDLPIAESSKRLGLSEVVYERGRHREASKNKPFYGSAVLHVQ